MVDCKYGYKRTSRVHLVGVQEAFGFANNIYARNIDTSSDLIVNEWNIVFLAFLLK